MRKRLLIHCSILLGLLFFATGRAVVNWNDGDTIVTDVVDENINIGGTVTIGDDVGGIQVYANTVDIVISVTTDSILQGQDRAPSRLYFDADPGRTITLNVEYNLTFRGSPIGVNPSQFLVLFRGGTGSELIINIWDDKEIVFTNAVAPDTPRGGTRFFVLMTDDSGIPQVIFNRNDDTSDANVTVEVGPDSLISYVAPTAVSSGNADEKAYIVFNPANNVANRGRMILEIQDTGGVYVGGNLIDDAIMRPELSDIDMTTPAGEKALFLVDSSGVSFDHCGLFVLNFNATLSDLYINPWNLATNPFDGTRYGFIVGANASVNINGQAYLDYVALANNICYIPDELLATGTQESRIKPRNPSALIIDGNTNQYATPAEIDMSQPGGVYFRSGIDRDGNILIDPDDINNSFWVDSLVQTPGAGEFVLDVEGQLEVIGTGGGDETALQILSLAVYPYGSKGFVLYDTTRENFPSRTFTKDGSGDYYVYNKGAFLVNNKMNLNDTNLVHTDANHLVCENNDERSEPTYVGGDTINFQEVADPVFLGRPKIAFLGSYFYVHTSVAVTGVDLLVPSRLLGNNSEFVFLGNGLDGFQVDGYQHDDGSGRNLILGTTTGSTACDGCTIISNDAHLDVFQVDYLVAGTPHELKLTTTCNNDNIHENITFVCGSCTAEPSTQTIYLGHSSNISIGTQTQFITRTYPVLRIAGNFFSFETRGGPTCNPAMSGTTGKGGIFVDIDGTFTIDDCFRANVSTMVTKSNNGIINLPKKQVFFDNKVGITDWQLNLAVKKTVIGADEKLSDYTLNWIEIEKDYGTFCPWIPGGSSSNCACESCCQPGDTCCQQVTTSNVSGIPTVLGEVDQFQIQGSRLSNPAHVLVDGGIIRELVFLPGCNSAEAPTAVLVVRNGATVGLGTNHKNIDALYGSVFLGINGITIIADGHDATRESDGEIRLNEDIIIYNNCHILKGPNAEDARLKFYSDVDRKIVVKDGGCLALSSFEEGDYVAIGGNISLVLEPGAKVILNGCSLVLVDNALIECPSVVNLDDIDGTDVTATDTVRVKFVGKGNVHFRDDSKMLIYRNAYVGVETDSCRSETDLTFDLTDKAQFKIGADELEGGVFQIGNTADMEEATVTFSLNIDGSDPKFEIGSRSMFGLAIGMITNLTTTAYDWRVGCLYNVESISITIESGSFIHNRTFPSSDSDASLLAIQDKEEDGPLYTFTFDPIKASILGGGNIASVMCDGSESIQPIVETDDGCTTSELCVGIMSSKMFLHDIFGEHKTDLPSDSQGEALYEYLKVQNVATGCYNILATAAPSDGHNQTNIGYVDGNYIARKTIDSILGRAGKEVDHEHSVEIGTVAVRLAYNGLYNGTPPRDIVKAFELP